VFYYKKEKTKMRAEIRRQWKQFCKENPKVSFQEFHNFYNQYNSNDRTNLTQSIQDWFWNQEFKEEPFIAIQETTET
jgi:hypothetical protein